MTFAPPVAAISLVFMDPAKRKLLVSHGEVLARYEWCEDMANRKEAAEIVARRNWINAPVADVVDRMQGKFDYGLGKVVENSYVASQHYNVWLARAEAAAA